MFSSEWSIESLQNYVDPNPNYLPPVETPEVVCDAIFYERPPTKVRKVKGKEVVPNPYQMVLSEMKLNFKKWETILSENAISLLGNKDHLNACLAYMLYCLANRKRFNLTYYMAKRIDYYLVDHVIEPLTEGRAYRFMVDRKPHSQTSLGSSYSPSPYQAHGEIDLVDNFTIDPIVYINQLPPIAGEESEEFKQTKGMFKCFVISTPTLERRRSRCRYHLQQRTVPSCRWNHPGRFYSENLAV
nr:hypothetical protein [Tanacetum cinerariifolium]